MCLACQRKYQDAILMLKWQSETLKATHEELKRYKLETSALWQGGIVGLHGHQIAELNELAAKTEDLAVSFGLKKILRDKAADYVRTRWVAKHSCQL